jgi:hypothetical protein
MVTSRTCHFWRTLSFVICSSTTPHETLDGRATAQKPVFTLETRGSRRSRYGVVGPALQQVFLIGAVRLEFFRQGSAQEIDVVIAGGYPRSRDFSRTRRFAMMSCKMR